MKIAGYSLTDVKATKDPKFKRSAINTNIEFTNIEKENLEILKDSEALKASFKFSVNYKESPNKDEKNNLAEVSYGGVLLLSVSKDESKEFIKSWKKKEVPKTMVLPLYNFILKKCSIKALQMEEDMGLPPHMPLPQVQPQKNN